MQHGDRPYKKLEDDMVHCTYSTKTVYVLGILKWTPQSYLVISLSQTSFLGYHYVVARNFSNCQYLQNLVMAIEIAIFQNLFTLDD